MPSVYDLKPRFQAFLLDSRSVGGLAGWRVEPVGLAAGPAGPARDRSRRRLRLARPLLVKMNRKTHEDAVPSLEP